MLVTGQGKRIRSQCMLLELGLNSIVRAEPGKARDGELHTARLFPGSLYFALLRVLRGSRCVLAPLLEILALPALVILALKRDIKQFFVSDLVFERSRRSAITQMFQCVVDRFD